MSETKKTLTVKLYGNLGRDPELRSTREQVYHPPAQASIFLGTATLPPTLARSILLQDGELPPGSLTHTPPLETKPPRWWTATSPQIAGRKLLPLKFQPLCRTATFPTSSLTHTPPLEL